MTNPYRDMCSDLIDALDSGIPAGRIRMSPLADLARALMGQPELTVPTDEEIMELMPQQMREDLAQAARAMTGVDMASFDNPKAAGAIRIILNRHAVDHARAVLDKWGHQ